MAKQESAVGKIVQAIKTKFSRLGNNPTVESGRSGTSLFSGIISEEFNPDLQI